MGLGHALEQGVAFAFGRKAAKECSPQLALSLPKGRKKSCDTDSAGNV